MKQLTTVILLLISAALLAPGGSVLAQEGTPAATPVDVRGLLQRASQGDVCAWPVTVAVDSLNVFYPEGTSAYFVTPYILAPGQALVIEGAYPFARFSSLVVR